MLLRKKSNTLYIEYGQSKIVLFDSMTSVCVVEIDRIQFDIQDNGFVVFYSQFEDKLNQLHNFFIQNTSYQIEKQTNGNLILDLCANRKKFSFTQKDGDPRQIMNSGYYIADTRVYAILFDKNIWSDKNIIKQKLTEIGLKAKYSKKEFECNSFGYLFIINEIKSFDKKAGMKKFGNEKGMREIDLGEGIILIVGVPKK